MRNIMTPLSASLTFFLDFTRAHAVLSRSFNGCLGGLGMSDFLILYQLSLASDHKLRRIDLAEKIGLTASGITRLLAPMEKIGLIQREENALDARVSYVSIAPGGKRMLKEALERAEIFCEDTFPSDEERELKKFSKFLHQVAKATP